MAAVLNATKQNLNFLAYKALDINATEDEIAAAVSAIVRGVEQWGFLSIAQINTSLGNGDITLDTYVIFVDTGEVNTAGRILELYG